jgi:hypothetical protein
MSSTQAVMMAMVLFTLVAGSVMARYLLRRRVPRNEAGSEYDRVLARSEARLAAEHEQRVRQRRDAALEFRTLSPQARAGYEAEWMRLRDLDASADTVNAADDLVTRLTIELGYPLGDNNKRVAQLSMDQVNTLESYREAHRIGLSNRRGEATGEQLRFAMVRFHALVADLLAEPGPVEILHQ